MQKLKLILMVFLVANCIFYLPNNCLAIATPVYMCPDVSVINTEPDGAIVPPSGWFTKPEFNMPAFIPISDLDTWREDITSIVYLQPIVYTWGISFTCIYLTFESTDRGLLMLFKIAPDKFSDKLWDTRTPNVSMQKCVDTNPHGSGICYWSLTPKQNNF